MTEFRQWCTVGDLVPVGDHSSGVIESHDDDSGIAIVARSLPEAYAESDSLALIADRLGKRAVARLLRNKLPTKSTSISATGMAVTAASRRANSSVWLERDSRGHHNRTHPPLLRKPTTFTGGGFTH